MGSSTTGDALEDYSCEHFPDQPVNDLELVAHFRSQTGDLVVNQQFANLGSDDVIASMQRAHRAHLRAAGLTPTELHRRAEMLESLMDELGTPPLGSSDDTATDIARVSLFMDAVREMVDIIAETAVRE